MSRATPFISNPNSIKRLNFAYKHLNLNVHDWENYLFSDETKFNLINSDGKTYIRRQVEEKFDKQCTIRTVKHGGGSLMYWGVFSSLGTAPLVLTKDTINQHRYIKILEHLLSYIAKNNFTNFKFVQDNVPCHSAKFIKTWLQSQNLSVIDWPLQSPDLNCIENLWSIIKNKVKKENSQNLHQLNEVVKLAWSNIDTETCIKLIHSMPKHSNTVIKSKGFSTKY